MRPPHVRQMVTSMANRRARRQAQPMRRGLAGGCDGDPRVVVAVETCGDVKSPGMTDFLCFGPP